MTQDKGFISMLLREDLKVPEVPFNGEYLRFMGS
jgi:hypothetical protein